MNEQASPSRILDFIYADHERVASFLSQMQDGGSLTETTTAGTAGKKKESNGGLNIGVFEGSAGTERDWRKEVRQTYDPLWTNSRRLVEHFESTPEHADIDVGQMRVIKGRLIAYDLSAISGMMNAEPMVEFIARGITDDSNNTSVKRPTPPSEKKKEAIVIRELMKSLPLGIGFVLVSDDAHFWFSVKREYLSLHDLDIPFKFVTHISGFWQVLGVVDALPNDHIDGIKDVVDRQIDGLIPAMALHMMQITGALVAMFGRPLPAYGLSPLAVYREIAT